MVGMQALSANLPPLPDGEGDSRSVLQRLLFDWATNSCRIIEHYQCILGFD